MKKVCLITPGHISSNPRLVKEATALVKANYAVHIVFTQYLPLLSKEDFDILNTCPSITFDVLDWVGNSIRSKFARLYSGVHQKAHLLLFKKTGQLKSLNKIENRHFNWQLGSAITAKADLYIAHNLAALPVAVEAAKKNGAKCGFDAEDFHRQQSNDDTSASAYINAKLIEDSYFPQLNYFTAASPLINEAYAKLYPNMQGVTINNVFPKHNIQQAPFGAGEHNNTLKLFWFSQTIGKNRGIEQALQAIGYLKNKNVSITLLGLITADNQQYFTSVAAKNGLSSNQLQFAGFKSPEQLFTFASGFDIGLALEVASPYNRNICLTNKLFTYLTCGLAIIASETLAQKQFIMAYPSAGKSFPINNSATLSKHIEYYLLNPDALVHTKKAALNIAINELNWETESTKFIKIVNELIH
jgi:glycosyltransferase involved in cell wall biosynthesis